MKHKKLRKVLTIVLIAVLAALCIALGIALGISRGNHAPQGYTLTYLSCEGGKIVGEATQTVQQGESGSEVTAVPDDGYIFLSWSDGEESAARTDIEVTENIIVTAHFAKHTEYTLTYLAGDGGTILGEATQTVPTGESGSEVEAVPDEGFVFIGWSDGEEAAKRTDTKVAENITVKAHFEKYTEYTLTYLAGSGGKIVGETTQTVPKGESGSEVTAVPDEIYEFYAWSDGVPTATRTDTEVTKDITVTAIFKLKASESEHYRSHLDLEVGATCPECGLEIYVKSGDGSILLYNHEEDYARAEYYGETVTNAFSSFRSMLREVYISEGVTSIGISAFFGCSELISLVIAANSKLSEISYSAFSGCSKLAQISLPESVISVGYSAFLGTAWYNAQPDGAVVYLGHIAYKYKGTMSLGTSLTLKEGTTAIADECFAAQGFLRGVSLPDTLQYIGSSAFYKCSSLLNITLPENLVSIERFAFYGCASITEMTIPASVVSIDGEIFNDCTSLKSVTFEDPEGWVNIYYSTPREVDFSDPAANVEKLQDYYSYYTKLKEE